LRHGGGSKKAGFSSLFSGFRKGDSIFDAAGEGGERITDEQFTLLPMRDLVLFPNTIVPVFITAQPGMAALDEALQRDKRCSPRA